MAKTTPLQFVDQVRTETRKVVWPTWKETWMTAAMVALMTSILAVFFLGIDTVFDQLVAALLKLAR